MYLHPQSLIGLCVCVCLNEYRIRMQPFLEAKDASKYLTFNGEVNITFGTRKPNIKAIELHSRSLNILEVMLKDESGNQIEIENKFQNYETLTEKLSLTLMEYLKRSKNYTLRIKYSGIIRDDAKGFFKYSCESKG